MKTLFDLFPVLLFFGAYKLFDIYVATGVMMAATVLQSAYTYVRERSLPLMQKVTLIMVLAFGAVTLGLHDERFIKWKPTVLYTCLAVGLGIAVFALRKNFLRALLGSQLELPDAIWNRLNVAWIAYCAFMAAINAYVVLNYSTEEWVNFKLWGYVFPLVFIVGQGLYIAPHMKLAEDPDEAPVSPDDAGKKP
jgi:intracellular septation protein